AALPDTPTFQEVGLGDIKASNYWAVAVPKATPPEIVEKLYQAFRASLSTPGATERFAKLGVVAVGTSPAETARRWRDEAGYWAKAVKDMAVRID
ncbi:MAG: tripartite tricarboxylate transporter substrate binding protein, partial [Betaproteobacteria bacterium]|nr:tripartite tricarboxylate transporter substrate binding protein [Betaproteobacteria bacterium]